MIIQPKGEMSFPWLSLITPGAMFFLMALFWQLNFSRYRIFCPLYAAGKGLGVCSTMFWLFIAKDDIVRELAFGDNALVITYGIVIFLLLGDTLSAWAAIKLMRNR